MNIFPLHLEIAVTDPAERAAVLALVFQNLPVEQRLAQVAATLTSVAAGEISLVGLLVARRDYKQVGAIWGSLSPGRTALVWPAQLVEGEAGSTAALLLEELVRILAAEKVCVAQALLPQESPAASLSYESKLSPAAQLFIDQGFQHLTDLQYMACDLADVAVGEPAEPILTFEPYSDELQDRLATIVDKTYQQTMDCPALNGVRDLDDVLEGYHQTGQFDPSRWLIVTHKAADVGCLLLADHPQRNQWELVYMGIVPSQRGYGWGLQIAQHALLLAKNGGREQLVLAVDVENDPAIAMYQAAGFTNWGMQQVFLKVF